MAASGWTLKYLILLAVLLLNLAGCGMHERSGAVPPAREPRFDQADYRLVWPLPVSTTARVTSYFGTRKDPFTGLINFHTGVDLDGRHGDPVYAAGEGRVAWAGYRSGYGNLLILDHGWGLTSWYGHCESFNTKRGQPVRRGKIIAGMGDSGRASGVHLHFEVRKHGVPVDPFQLLPALKTLK